MNEDILNRMSDAIEQLLAEMRAPCLVDEGWLTPGLVTFRLKPVAGTRVDAVMRLRKDLALALRASTVRIGRQIGYITVQVPNGTPDVYLDDMLRNAELFQGTPPMTAPIGIAEDGVPTLLHVGNNTSNVLISGLMGSGKTTLAHSLLIGLCARNSPRAMRLILCDPKRHDLAWMRQWIGANLEGSIRHEPAEIASAIADVAQRVENARGRERDTVLFIDELGWVLNQTPEVIEPLKRIMKRGREFGFRLITCEPVPGTAPVAGDLLASFHVRITGRQADGAASYSATGVSNAGADTLTGMGDMLAVHFGNITRFRAVRPPKGFEGQRLLPAATAGMSVDIPAVTRTPLAPGVAPDVDDGEGIAVDVEVDVELDGEDADTDAKAWITPEIEAELEADRQVFWSLVSAGAGGSQLPGVTRWAAVRWDGQWSVPYAGDRIAWMRPRYEAAKAACLARQAAKAGGLDAETLVAIDEASELLSAAKACFPAPKGPKPAKEAPPSRPPQGPKGGRGEGGALSA